MQRKILKCFALFGLTASAAQSATIVTNDPGAIAAFQDGQTVVSFEGLPTVAGSGSGNTGASVPMSSQLSTELSARGVVFSSDGGPVGVISVEGLSNEGDALSPFNMIGGTSISPRGPVLNYLAPIELVFTGGPISRVGAWNDPTGSRIELSVFDSGGVLIDSVEGGQGTFIGIDAEGISSATFSFVSREAVFGFALDDVTFGNSTVEVIPVPAGFPLLGSGLLFLAFAARRRR